LILHNQASMELLDTCDKIQTLIWCVVKTKWNLRWHFFC